MSQGETDIPADEDGPSPYSAEVGKRLRAVRKAQGLSLDEVERRSNGRWSASAVGAYERGFRNLTLPRLRALADFYDVPVDGLLAGEEPAPAGGSSRIVLDLHRLRSVPEAAAVRRFLDGIIHERGDYNGRILTVRQHDVRALCAIEQVDERGLLVQLRSWGAIVEEAASHSE